VSALAPVDYPDDLDEGGAFTTDESARWAESVVADALESAPNSVLIGLECLAQRSDPFLDRRPEERGRAWFHGEEIYWRFLPDQTAEQSLRDALRRPSGYGMNGVSIVTERPRDVEVELDAGQLRFLADHTRVIVVEVFDAEGYAVWRPAT
jgi:hypothetical protein